jgi:O-antigen ligase
MAAGLMVLNYRSHKVMLFLRVNAPILLFLFYCAISVLWSDFPFVAAKRWVKALGVFVMVLIILTDLNPLAATKRFFSRAAFLLLPLSVLFIVFYPKLGTAYDPSARITYYIGVTTQKNELGLTCLVCGLGSLWSFLNAYDDRKMPHRARHLIAHGIILVMALGLIKTCDSMTSLSCLVIAGAVMALTTHPWVAKHANHVHVLVGSALALALFADFIDSTGALLRLLGRNATLTGRTEIWKAVLSFHTNPLVGIGYDSFWLGSRIERVWQLIGFKGIAEAHNGYLEIYINLGCVGLTMLGILLVSGYGHALSTLRNDPHIGRLRMAFFTACLIYNLSESGFKMMTPLWIAFLLEITTIPAILQPQMRMRMHGVASAQGKATPRIRLLR